MSDAPSIVPIFPLPLVVAPGERVALHIFEERYKAMIARCRDLEAQGLPGEFVIACSAEGAVAGIGTVLRIETMLKEYEDGRSDLLARGLRRCAISEVRDDASYHTAVVQPVRDDDSDWAEDLATLAVRLHRRLVGLVTQNEPPDSHYDGKACLSFALLPTSGLATEERQKVLEMRSENERLAFLVNHMEATLRQVSEALNAIATIRSAWELKSIVLPPDAPTGSSGQA